MSGVETGVFFAAWCFGGLVNGLTGLGGAMVALPLFSWFVPMEQAVPVACFMGGFISFETFLRHRAHVRVRPLVWLALGSLPGVVVGTWVLQVIPGNWLRLGLALFLAGYVLRPARPRTAEAGLPAWVGGLAGFCSGLINAAISFGGPPAAVYAEASGWDQRTAKALLAGYFVVMSLSTFFAQVATGLFTPAVWKLVAIGIPAALCGAVLSLPLVGRMPDAVYRKALRLLLAGSAALLVGKVVLA